MYVPPAFAENRLPLLHEAIRGAGIANLVTTGPDGLIATPLPLLIDPGEGANGTLYGHVARANPQWQRTDRSVEALAIFMGPDAYVTPSWYETKRQTGKVVPTWNYVTIHAYGPVEFFDDPAALRAVVERLTERHEGQRTAPWAVSDAPEPFVAGQLKGIVGLRLPISRLQGKWKVSQNRPPADRAGVAEGMRADGAAVMADLVEPPA